MALQVPEHISQALLSNPHLSILDLLRHPLPNFKHRFDDSTEDSSVSVNKGPVISETDSDTSDDAEIFTEWISMPTDSLPTLDPSLSKSVADNSQLSFDSAHITTIFSVEKPQRLTHPGRSISPAPTELYSEGNDDDFSLDFGDGGSGF